VKKITPPVLRHTKVMRLLTAGIDSTVIAFLEVSDYAEAFTPGAPRFRARTTNLGISKTSA
jgi:hypothetical protein